VNDDEHNDVWVSCCQYKPWYGISQGAFLVTITEKKHQVTQARNNFLQIIFTIVYAMNQNGWLALIICTEKKSEKLQFAKTGFWPIPSTSVLPAVAKEFTR